MENTTQIKNKTTRMYNNTLKKMESLGTWKDEFEIPVRRYAELRIQYDMITEKWYANGCKITEEYTNKSGAVNERKTPLYSSLENLRKELIEFENIFGLTPKGLKQINSGVMKKAKGGALSKALSNMNG